MSLQIAKGGASPAGLNAKNTIAIESIGWRRGVALCIAVALGLFCQVSGARADAPATTQPASVEPDNADLRQEIDALNAKVNRLEARLPESSDTTQPAIQIQNQIQQPGLFSTTDFATGYDPMLGFVIRSDNGEFSLHPGAVLDFRYMANYREKIPTGGGGETDSTGYSTENGFNIVRARLTLDGNFTKDVTYFIQLQDDEGTSPGLLDAYWVYHFTDSPFAVKVGQFKDPIWHERNLSEATLLAVDRSLAEYLLGGGQTSRVQGVSLMYDQDQFRAQAVFHDGFNSLNSKFYDQGGLGAGVGGGAGVTPTNFGVSGRAEYMVIGDRTSDFNPFMEYDHGFTALGDRQDILVLGAGGDYSQAGSNGVIFHTADAQYDTADGFSAYGAYLGSYRDLPSNQGVTPGIYYDPGFVAQAGYLVTPQIEPFARYDYTYLNDAHAEGLSTGEAQEITVGANYYLHKQNVKFTLDASWLPNGAPSDSDALGILKDSGHNEYVLRFQFQLAL
jgi:hypothetical protein